MASKSLVVVGKGRMGAALYASLRPWYSPASHVAGRAAANEPVKRPRSAPVTWILAVSDRVIPAVCDALAPAVEPGDCAFHLAGMLGPEALATLQTRGARVASLHPLYAVAAAEPRITTLSAPAFVFEGDRAALAEARKIARRCEGTLVVASRVDRARYHGAAALMATGAVALAQGAARLFAESLTPAPTDTQLRAMTGSLLRSVAVNVNAVGLDRALASPLLRDDTDTVARHLGAMDAEPAVRDLYRAAVALVIEALERNALVSPETITKARALVKR
jgi:predicted short-subunit dehydrogenase-like oxidoreductase (DUF2520 family)